MGTRATHTSIILSREVRQLQRSRSSAPVGAAQSRARRLERGTNWGHVQLVAGMVAGCNRRAQRAPGKFWAVFVCCSVVTCRFSKSVRTPPTSFPCSRKIRLLVDLYCSDGLPSPPPHLSKYCSGLHHHNKNPRHAALSAGQFQPCSGVNSRWGIARHLCCDLIARRDQSRPQVRASRYWLPRIRWRRRPATRHETLLLLLPQGQHLRSRDSANTGLHPSVRRKRPRLQWPLRRLEQPHMKPKPSRCLAPRRALRIQSASGPPSKDTGLRSVREHWRTQPSSMSERRCACKPWHEAG